MSLTNLVVVKIETNCVRIDTGSTMSTIVLPDHSEQVQLFHPTKTYQWIVINESAQTNASQEFPIPAGETTLNDTPARLFCWTNGTEHGRIWVVHKEKFLHSFINRLATNQPPNITGNLGVGQLFDTNSIIARTERTTISPILLQDAVGTNNSETADSNVTITTTSELISITETNFNPSEFVIPTDYQEASAEPPQHYQVNPANFGRGPIGGGNLEGLRKAYEKGSPVLAPIPIAGKFP